MKTGREAKSCLSVSAAHIAHKDRRTYVDSRDEGEHAHTHAQNELSSPGRRLSTADHSMSAGRYRQDLASHHQKHVMVNYSYMHKAAPKKKVIHICQDIGPWLVSLLQLEKFLLPFYLLGQKSTK